MLGISELWNEIAGWIQRHHTIRKAMKQVVFAVAGVIITNAPMLATALGDYGQVPVLIFMVLINGLDNWYKHSSWGTNPQGKAPAAKK